MEHHTTEQLGHHNIHTSPTTLPELPQILHQGLTAVSVLALLSVTSASALFLHLGYRLFRWKHRSQVRCNQFVVIIFNLLLADIQQSTAFVINSKWVHDRSIVSGGPACWAQGWFVSIGDLSSGLFTCAIAMHAFADIVYDYRLSQRTFRLSLLGLWTFTFLCAGIALALHRSNLYVRAGAWCWIDMKYIHVRLWLHCFWVILAMLAIVVLYAIITIVLHHRVSGSYYTTSTAQLRIQTTMKVIIAYPTIYVVCTLPLIISRLRALSGYDVGFTELCVAAAMITSNGWLDVLLYSLTRTSVLFGSDLTNQNIRALETFTATSNWRPDGLFGTTTTVEAGTRNSRQARRSQLGQVHGTESLEQLHNERKLSVVQVETTVHVSVEDVELKQVHIRMGVINERRRSAGGDPDCIKGSLSFDTATTNEK